jgi:uncharacterized protein
MKISIPESGYLRVKVTPKSSKTELTEILKDEEGPTHKIRLKAVPEKGKANEELIRFLAKELNLPRSAFSIISGKTDRLKLIKIAP